MVSAAATPLSLFPASQWSGRIPSLDGVRALSFLLVFVSHMGFLGSRPGGFGVSVFFLLSGYLITTLLLREHSKTGTISLRNFYYRRTLRIFPSGYAVLIICALLSYWHVLKIPFKASAFFFQALYLENYAFWWNLSAGRHSFYIAGTGHYWSLCVEEHFYLLFPLLLLVMLRRKMNFEQISRALFVICLGVLVWRIIAVRIMPLGEEYCYLATDARLDSILWGCFLATVEHHDGWRKLLTYNRLLWLIPFAFVLLALTFVFHASGRMTFRFTLQSIALLPILYLVTHYDKSWLARPLNHPVLVHLGTLSYALYLVHGAAIEIVSAHIHGGRLIVWSVCGVAAYLAALALHWAVERPFLAMRAKHRTA
ncbi:MAG: acyltransferase [Silvibacterium sp.]|nr:acyltransferase [Silvibacterium sp.]